ncbi:MAG: mandelate racemase/muconate lactonizing enzyme family protein [Planctomycetes bacterium]|nr:mandelate racemase/muconate lactonizing enzyme family protein [Planctomycetota bacterium]
MSRIATIEAFALEARFADYFGGTQHVPPAFSQPAAHFRALPRLGQASTLVRVRDTEGHEGWGESWGLPLPQASALLVEKLLAPVLKGAATEPVDACAELLWTCARQYGHDKGFLPEAISGIELALWDLAGRRAGKPVAQMLNPQARERIACYASPVPFLDRPEQSAAAARAFAEQGHRGVKLKVGRGVETDRTHAAAVRAALGPQAELMLDANGAYGVESALQLARAVEPLRIAWLEEPVAPDDLDALVRVKRNSPVPLAAGEHEFCPAGLRALVERGAVDVLTPNVSRCGGIGAVRSAAACAREHGVRLALHGVGAGITLAASLHVLAALPVEGLFEANRFLNPLRESLTQPVLSARDGAFDLPAGPGWGVTPHPEALRRFAVSA